MIGGLINVSVIFHRILMGLFSECKHIYRTVVGADGAIISVPEIIRQHCCSYAACSFYRQSKITWLSVIALTMAPRLELIYLKGAKQWEIQEFLSYEWNVFFVFLSYT